MIRVFLAKAADVIANEVMGTTSQPSIKVPRGPTVGMTKDALRWKLMSILG